MPQGPLAATTVTLAATTALVTLSMTPPSAAAPAAPGAAAQAAAPAPAAAGKDSHRAKGYGGAVVTVDKSATKAGMKVLRRGGNAVDAAVAAAAALGVSEPFSAGIGGGGYFVYYDAKTKKVRTIDGRETAPMKIRNDAFIDPATNKPYTFTPDLVTSGVSVGVPGTPATWDKALRKWGTWSLGEALAPAVKVARNGFKVDKTFHQQVSENQIRFEAFKPTRKLFLPGGKPAPVGSRMKNPDLAETYELLGTKGISRFYGGALAREIVDAVQEPPKTKSTTLPVPPGSMTRKDLKQYDALVQKPSKSSYRGYDVYGMAPSSSGGSTVGEALNIIERADLSAATETAVLHRYLEAGALAFADRAKYLGDPAFVDVPLKKLLDDTYAAERACAIDPAKAAKKPVAAGDVNAYDGVCPAAPGVGEIAEDTENISTTNLTTSDRWGNVVEYTLTIEQTGGSGIVVPGRGFILNNELTDFSTVYDAADPNRIQPGKRPRSSMSPTIVLSDGRPFLALGSPGGSTIITTVLQTLVNRIDLEMSLDDAVQAPRSSPRNTASVSAEQSFIDAYGAALTALGHTFAPSGEAGTSAAEIGALTAIEFRGKNRVIAVAEETRRGGGWAMVESAKRIKPQR